MQPEEGDPNRVPEKPEGHQARDHRGESGAIKPHGNGHQKSRLYQDHRPTSRLADKIKGKGNEMRPIERMGVDIFPNPICPCRRISSLP